jgi:hypothetical protein
MYAEAQYEKVRARVKTPCHNVAKTITITLAHLSLSLVDSVVKQRD